MNRVWKISKSRPQKQSNFGVYKQVISAGEGMDLRRVTITGDTPEIVQEVAQAACAVSGVMEALNQMASWGEGKEVTGGFDEPCAARIARAAIAEVRGE